MLASFGKDFAFPDWYLICFSDVDQVANHLTAEMLYTIEAHVPFKLVFDNASVHPWCNERCRELISEKRKLEGTRSKHLAGKVQSRLISRALRVYAARARRLLRYAAAPSNGGVFSRS